MWTWKCKIFQFISNKILIVFNHSSLIICALIVAEVIAKTTDLKPKSTSDEVLSRNKRFLVYVPNGGVIKFVTGYLGPIDIPLWQNINCLRNLQFQYDLPQNWTTRPASFQGLTRSQGRGFSSSEIPKPKPDSSRKIAYEVVQDVLERFDF